MTPMVLALVTAFAASGTPAATPWNPQACKPALDPQFVHKVKPAADAGSPTRRLNKEAAAREAGTADPAKPCIVRGPAYRQPGVVNKPPKTPPANPAKPAP